MLAPEHTKDIAARMIRANADFIGQLQSFGDLSRAEASKVLDYFVSKKMVKADYVLAVIRVKHGRYLDRDFLQSLADKL